MRDEKHVDAHDVAGQVEQDEHSGHQQEHPGDADLGGVRDAASTHGGHPSVADHLGPGLLGGRRLCEERSVHVEMSLF